MTSATTHIALSWSTHGRSGRPPSRPQTMLTVLTQTPPSLSGSLGMYAAGGKCVELFHSRRLGFGQVDRFLRGRTERLRCDCRSIERTHKCAGVLLQRFTVDIFDCVTGLVIAGIVRVTSRTAEQVGFGFRLR